MRSQSVDIPDVQDLGASRIQRTGQTILPKCMTAHGCCNPLHFPKMYIPAVESLISVQSDIIGGYKKLCLNVFELSAQDFLGDDTLLAKASRLRFAKRHTPTANAIWKALERYWRC